MKNKNLYSLVILINSIYALGLIMWIVFWIIYPNPNGNKTFFMIMLIAFTLFAPLSLNGVRNRINKLEQENE